MGFDFRPSSASSLQVTDTGLRLHTFTTLADAPLDVLFDGRRVWTFRPEKRRGFIDAEWPPGLAERLQGSATVSIAPTGTDEPIATVEARFADDATPLDLADEEGREMVVNKWGEMTTQFDASGEELQSAIIALAKKIVDVLQDDGHEVMITSGTLLGWVRTGRLLPTDDDADLALVVSDTSSPADIAITGMRVRRTLQERGFDVLLHSAVHLQVRLGGEGIDGDSYCDVFLGFFRGDVYCQPFHLRDMVPRSSLSPTVPVELDDTVLPAPPRPEDWLAACYGPDWATPDPGFVFDTPRATRERYENWFGSFNFGRDHWDRLARFPRGPQRLSRVHVDAVAESARSSGAALVIDAGCGTGTATAEIAGGHRVRAFDFSERAVRRARRLLGDEVVSVLNLADGRDVLDAEIDVVASAPAVVSMHEVLHVLPRETRANVYRLIRAAVRSGGAAVATFPTVLDESRYTFRDPGSWHLPLEQVEQEAAQAGVRVRSVEFDPTSGMRRRVTVTFETMDDASSTPAPRGERAMT